MAKFYGVVFLGVVAAAISVVSAITDDERNAIRLASLPILASCGREHGITKEQVLAARQAKDLDALNPCFYACFFKKTDAMNSEGIVDPTAAKAKHRKYVHGQDDLVKLDAIVDKCSSVNDQTVSDGAQGCDRSKLLARCFIDNKAFINPFI